MTQATDRYAAIQACPLCGDDIEIVIRFTVHYDDWSGAWEGDVEFVNDADCPNGCTLTRHQWDDLLCTASEAVMDAPEEATPDDR